MKKEEKMKWINKILQLYKTKNKDILYDPDLMDLSIGQFNTISIDCLIYMMDNNISYNTKEYSDVIKSMKEQFPISAYKC